MLDRRTFYVAIGSLAVGTFGTSAWWVVNEVDPKPVEVEPSSTNDEVQSAAELSGDYLRALEGTVRDPRVYVGDKGSILATYQSRAETPASVKQQFHDLVDLYVETASDGHEPRTLTLRTAGLRAIVPVTALRAHLSGEIDRNALHETVAISDVGS
jgi:hypothetical protein